MSTPQERYTTAIATLVLKAANYRYAARVAAMMLDSSIASKAQNRARIIEIRRAKLQDLYLSGELYIKATEDLPDRDAIIDEAHELCQFSQKLLLKVHQLQGTRAGTADSNKALRTELQLLRLNNKTLRQQLTHQLNTSTLLAAPAIS